MKHGSLRVLDASSRITSLLLLFRCNGIGTSHNPSNQNEVFARATPYHCIFFLCGAFGTLDITIGCKKYLTAILLRALHDHLLLGANDCSFSNLLAANGGWDIDKLSNTFMAEAINHIISIKGPDPSNADDMIFGQRLMTNSERCQRGVGYSIACPGCPITEEIVLLILRDCKYSKDAWLHLMRWELIVDFFQYELHYLAPVQSLFLCSYHKG
ncbi:hypothetical protein V6N12_045105 [Hibiscus sabdariffa]|uniref:Uncharacterized protein n=1 Tax=Hibiscus sabdariffa TaxID=183260 RepID=A0ABR2G1U7_9ROSI